MIGEVRSSARAVSGNAPFTLPTLIGPLPKLILRCLVSSAVDASGGNDCSRSKRSLLRPGLSTTLARSLTVGTASWANGRSCARNGRSAIATGFEALTSGSTSFSVARRFTNVVFDWRMNAGSWAIACASASRWLPSARNVAFALLTNAARSSRFAATASTSLALSTRKRESSGESRFSSPNRRAEVERAGFR